MNAFFTMGIFIFIIMGCGLDKKNSGSFAGNDAPPSEESVQNSGEPNPGESGESHVIDPETGSDAVPIEVIDVESGEEESNGEEGGVKNYKIVIWPPDNKWRNFMLRDTLQNSSCAIDRIDSNDNEAIEGEDYVRNEDGLFKVMAEKHSESKKARIYNVTASCENGDKANIELEVPYSQSGGKDKDYKKKPKKEKKPKSKSKAEEKSEYGEG